VLILIVSPLAMNSGTLVLSPVSSVASFSRLVAVAPLMPAAYRDGEVNRRGEFDGDRTPLVAEHNASVFGRR
jgi:hypothetical protein